MPSPATTALMLFASVTVARITLAPPSLVSSSAAFCARAVDVQVSAELFGQRRFVRAARDRHGLESHLGRELHAQVTQAADPQNGDEIASDARRCDAVN